MYKASCPSEVNNKDLNVALAEGLILSAISKNIKVCTGKKCFSYHLLIFEFAKQNSAWTLLVRVITSGNILGLYRVLKKAGRAS